MFTNDTACCSVNNSFLCCNLCRISALSQLLVLSLGCNADSPAACLTIEHTANDINQDTHTWAVTGRAAEEGKATLMKVVTWAATDAAGPGLPLLRTALLDLASIHLAEAAVPAAMGCLQAAAAAGQCLDQLLKAPQALGPVSATSIPTWAVQLLQGMFCMAGQA